MPVNQDIRDELPDEAIVFDNYAYDNSIIGVTFDGRAIYSFEDMVAELMEETGWDELSAMDWVDYNTVRSLQYCGGNAPLIVQKYI